MTRPVEFHYKCPKCGWSSVSLNPDEETCPIPWGPDGVAVLKPDDDTPRCGGDIGGGGPSVWWWMIPEGIQAEILRHNERVKVAT